MNVKFMNPFVAAAVDVLKAECQLDVQRGNLALHKSALTVDDITVLISMVGRVQGVVLYGMSVPTGLALVSRMTGQEFAEFDNLAQSGVTELGNVITDKVTVNLLQAGYDPTISPPALIQGKGVEISTLDFERIVVPLMTELGEVIVHLAVQESPPDIFDTNIVPATVPVQVQS